MSKGKKQREKGEREIYMTLYVEMREGELFLTRFFIRSYFFEFL